MGQVFVDPRFTLPGALLVAAVLVFYWIRLGREGVPATRRRVRRLSLFIMLLSLPAFVRGLSYVNPQQHATDFVITWTAATVMLLLVVATALADALVSLRLHRQEFEKEIEKAGTELREAARRARDREQTTEPEMSGEDEP